MINLYVVLVLLFFHWIGDFVFQTDEMAKGKSKHLDKLLDHTIIYSLVWVIIMSAVFAIFEGNMEGKLSDYSKMSLMFTGITFTCHTVQDFFTSRLNSYLYTKSTHYFFVSIGFDQFMHFVQLLLTYKFVLWLFQN